MAVDVKNLIAAINPDLFCAPELVDQVKALVKEKGYLEAAAVAKMKDIEPIDEEKTYYSTAVAADALKTPIEKHVITYESVGENLEPIYFWLLDYLNTDFKKPKGVDKLVDNFISSVGSSHFSEMGMKATKMQDEAMKLLGSANQVIKSIINILYDLKEFKQRLKLYDQANSQNKEESEKGILSLKQVWLDTVDMKRGNTGIKAMAAQYQYVTLIDAFFVANKPEDVKVLDLNERVKKILEQRVNEFYIWLKESKDELKKRFEIEKIYLRSQVNSVQLYSKWMKPYLRAARDLEQKMPDAKTNAINAASPAGLVNTFNTTIFELTLLARGEYDFKGDVGRGDLPKIIETAKDKRAYFAMMIVELKFRSIPGRAGNSQNYVHKGRVDAVFTGFALNEDEIKVLKEQIAKDDMKDMNSLIEGATEQSLDVLMSEINEYLDEDKKEEPKEEKKESDDVNPFAALLDGISEFFSFKKKDKTPADLSKGVPKDNDVEKVLRSQATIQARVECSKMYGLFKKAQGMSA